MTKNSCYQQFQMLFLRNWTLLILFSFVFCPISWATKDAIVISEHAVIYSDLQMSSAIGYVPKGKRLKIGDVARNNSMVFPIVVSGKIAYIKSEDVTTQIDDPNAKTITLERFKKHTKREYTTKYSLSYVSYATTVYLPKGNPNGLKDGDSFNMQGVSLKGETYLANLFDLQMMLNYLYGGTTVEKFRYFEAGVGAGFRFVNFEKIKISGELQALGIPFASYSYENKFRVNGFGYTVGAGGTLSAHLSEHWGLEGSAGIYYTKLNNFVAPKKYQSISPGFYGPRIYAGVNYQF
jgi:hypothetical protein